MMLLMIASKIPKPTPPCQRQVTRLLQAWKVGFRSTWAWQSAEKQVQESQSIRVENGCDTHQDLVNKKLVSGDLWVYIIR